MKGRGWLKLMWRAMCPKIFEMSNYTTGLRELVALRAISAASGVGDPLCPIQMCGYGVDARCASGIAALPGRACYAGGDGFVIKRTACWRRFSG